MAIRIQYTASPILSLEAISIKTQRERKTVLSSDLKASVNRNKEKHGTHRDRKVANSVHFQILCYFEIFHLSLVPKNTDAHKSRLRSQGERCFKDKPEFSLTLWCFCVQHTKLLSSLPTSLLSSDTASAPGHHHKTAQKSHQMVEITHNRMNTFSRFKATTHSFGQELILS